MEVTFVKLYLGIVCPHDYREHICLTYKAYFDRKEFIGTVITQIFSEISNIEPALSAQSKIALRLFIS